MAERPVFVGMMSIRGFYWLLFLSLTFNFIKPALADDEAFRQALVDAYTHNPALKAQREAQKALDEDVSQAFSAFRPDAELAYNRGRGRLSSDDIFNYGNSDSRSITITQPLFSGALLGAFQAAKARVKAGRAALLAAEQQLLYDTVNAYTDVVEQQSLLELSRNNEEVLQKELDAAIARFKAGELTRTDSSQAEARAAKAQADTMQAAGNLASAQAGFKRLVGTEPQALSFPTTNALLPVSLEAGITQAVERNPAMLNAYFTEKAADKEVAARIGTLLPDVSLQGSISDAKRFSGSARNGSGRDDRIMLNVTIPLYQSGAEYSRIRQSKDRLQQARFESMDMHNQVVETATRAWQDYTASSAVTIATQAAINAAEVALEGTRKENTFGTRTLLDVLDAEQELFTRKVDLVRAQHNVILQSYHLVAATGKLTAADLQLPVDSYDPIKHYNDVKYQFIGF